MDEYFHITYLNKGATGVLFLLHPRKKTQLLIKLVE